MKYLLGFEIDITDQGILISQHVYAERVLTRFGIDNYNSRKTLLDPNTIPPKSTEDVDQARIKLY